MRPALWPPRFISGLTAACIVLGLSTCCFTARGAEGEEGFVSIFDGKTLEGWEGKSEFWSVKDGAITGQTTAERQLDKNTFIIWRAGEVADFELRLKFRIVKGNSGIQYRSEELDDFVVKGYQADIDAGMRFMGILYEERGRGILAERGQQVELAADEKKISQEGVDDGQGLLDSINEEGWNDYVIIAQGNRLIHKINGFTSVDVTDNQADKRAAKGILALQLHQGPPMVVQFKDIHLKQPK